MAETAYSQLMRVLVVDDQAILRDGLTALLALEDDVEVTGAATNGREALELALTARPDVVLMDVRMPVMDGIEATRQFVLRGGPPVVLLTTFEEVEDMTGGLNAGAHGYLFKSASIDEILHALKSAVRGEKVIHPRVAQHLARQMTRSDHQVAPPPIQIQVSDFTDRELEVLKGMAQGQSNKQIGNVMGISEGTVKVHVGNILTKLGAQNRTQAVLRANELQLLPQ